MRLLVIGDLHGRVPEIPQKKFDAIIAPGDFCSDAPRKYMFQALKQSLDNPKKEVYWWDIIGKKKAQEMTEKSLRDGRKILKGLNSLEVPVYMTPGNWDWTPWEESPWSYMRQDFYSDLIDGLDNLVDTHHRLVDTTEYIFIGHGITSGPEYPQTRKEKERYSKSKLRKIKREYQEQFSKVDNLFKAARIIGKPVIFLSHNAPYNTHLDMINNPDSPRNGQHFGSVIARKMIDKHLPLVNLCGHMHEDYGKSKISKTLSINSGFGSKPNVLLELEGNKINGVSFRDIPNYQKYLARA